MHYKKPQNQFRFCFALILCILLFGAKFAHADVSTSTSYTMLDPVLNAGGYGSSTSFKLSGVISGVAIGTSTSLSFGNSAGFLYFPFASTPVVSATAGSSQVALSWTASTGYLGWTASGYNIGRSTSSGGPYSYTSLGNVTSSTVTGLTNATTYYFVIVVKDAFGNPIATSSQVSATPVAAVTTTTSSGGGGGFIPTVTTGAKINISGRAYPMSQVTVLKDGQVIVKTVAGPDAKFSTSLTGLSTGSYSIAVYGEDSKGNRSTSFSFPVTVSSGTETNIGGVFFSPPPDVDQKEERRGGDIVIFGQSSPPSNILVSVNSEQEIFSSVKSDNIGAYLLNFDSSVLDLGSHSAKSKASIAGEISPFSQLASFIVGTKNIVAVKEKIPPKGDLSGDNRVNLVDFSIAAYWYRRPSPPARADLNSDGKVDLRDFSILAFNWTG